MYELLYWKKFWNLRHVALFALYIFCSIEAWHKWQLIGPIKLRKVRFQLQKKLRQSTSKGNEFSARVSVSETSCPDFRKTLRKSLQTHCNDQIMWTVKRFSNKTNQQLRLNQRRDFWNVLHDTGLHAAYLMKIRRKFSKLPAINLVGLHCNFHSWNYNRKNSTVDNNTITIFLFWFFNFSPYVITVFQIASYPKLMLVSKLYWKRSKFASIVKLITP